MKIFKLIVFVVAMLTVHIGYGQSPKFVLPNLNDPADRNNLERTAKLQVEHFANCLEKIVDTQTYPSIVERKKFITRALSLFIGEGESFELLGRMFDGVKIEITSVSTGKPKPPYYVKNYLKRICDLAEDYYTEVHITTVDVMKCSDIKVLEDGKYECTITYSQKFLARRSDGGLTGDVTVKHVKVYLFVKFVPSGVKIIPKLGDISAGETKKIRK